MDFLPSLAQLPYPKIDPIFFQIGPLAFRWYGLMYLLGLGGAYWLIKTRAAQKQIPLPSQTLSDLIVFAAFGVFIGGRLGYVLFYNLPFYIDHPLKVFAVWEGGMSFHGGAIATLIVGYFFCKKNKISYLHGGDLAVVPISLTLLFSRLANFIIRELVGRVIENPRWEWLGVDFGDKILRYPSQLFQAASAILLFLVLLFIFSRKPKKGVVLFSYLLFYGLFRIITEFWRAPDPQIGFICGFFTLGQILSFLMLLAGVIGFIVLKRWYKS